MSGRTVVLTFVGAILLLVVLVLASNVLGRSFGGILWDFVAVSAVAIALMALMPRNRKIRSASRIRPWAVSFVRAALLLLIAAGNVVVAIRTRSMVFGVIGGSVVFLVLVHIANLAAQRVWLEGGRICARSLWRRVDVPVDDVVEMRLEPAPGWAMAFSAHTKNGVHHRIRLASFEENTLLPLAERVGLREDQAHGQPGAFRWVRPEAGVSVAP